MNKRLKQLSEARRWVVAIAMFSLLFGSVSLLGGFPVHASTQRAVTPTLLTWRVVSSPNVGASANGLSGVAVVSANDIWAVGNYLNSTGINKTLIERWNGSAWSIVSSPNVGTGDNFLADVAVVSASDVWAVGRYQDTSTYTLQTLIEHWNGSTWSVVSSPNVGRQGNSLTGVARVSASDVWAVGLYHSSSTRSYRTLIEHWNGSAWSVVSSPNVGGISLYGVAKVSASDIWAVGDYSTATTSQTLIEHYSSV